MRYDLHIRPKTPLSLRTCKRYGKTIFDNFQATCTQYVTKHAAAQAAHTTIAGSNELF